jgi:predicted peroxiredoxin
MKKLVFLLILMTSPIMSFSQDHKTFFIHLSSDPMKNPSAAMMSIHSASEALNQGHKVIYFAAGDGTRIFLKDVINNLHTVTAHGGGFGNISRMAKQKLLEFSNNGGIIHVSEGSFKTYGINQTNYKEHLIEVKQIFWSYPTDLIKQSAKADIVFSY